MMQPNEFAKQYYLNMSKKSENEVALRKAIIDGRITPDMSLRQMGKVIGIGNPQLVKHYIDKFLKEREQDNRPGVVGADGKTK